MNALLSVADGIGVVIPRHQSRSGAEGIGEGVAHDVPVRRREAEVFAHGLSFDHFVGIVMFEGKGVFGGGALVNNFGYFREVGFAHENLPVST